MSSKRYEFAAFLSEAAPAKRPTVSIPAPLTAFHDVLLSDKHSDLEAFTFMVTELTRHRLFNLPSSKKPALKARVALGRSYNCLTHFIHVS